MTYEEMTTQHGKNTAALEGDTNAEYNLEELVTELAAAREENRKLQDQLKKTVKAASNAERASAEALRAHTKMVETLTETMRENTALTIERDMWQARARRAAAQAQAAEQVPVYDIRSSLEVADITEAEVRAIRKAIARLHHPDAGGNAERMKMWNASLDRLERRSS
jgi:regulator of replication initiation timing